MCKNFSVLNENNVLPPPPWNFPVYALALDFGVSSSKGLFPSIFNLGTHAEVRANTTCGSGRQEQYCTLGDSKDTRYVHDTWCLTKHDISKMFCRSSVILEKLC